METRLDKFILVLQLEQVVADLFFAHVRERFAEAALDWDCRELAARRTGLRCRVCGALAYC